MITTIQDVFTNGSTRRTYSVVHHEYNPQMSSSGLLPSPDLADHLRCHPHLDLCRLSPLQWLQHEQQNGQHVRQPRIGDQGLASSVTGQKVPACTEK